jgi:hypothetical protein
VKRGDMERCFAHSLLMELRRSVDVVRRLQHHLCLRFRRRCSSTPRSAVIFDATAFADAAKAAAAEESKEPDLDVEAQEAAQREQTAQRMHAAGTRKEERREKKRAFDLVMQK